MFSPLKKSFKAGFTLIEMLVAVGIFTLMSAVLLYNYPEFNSRSALDNLAHQIAISIREAQVYGLSVRQTSAVYPGYGIYIDKSNPTTFILFGDKNDNKIYDAGELVSQFDLTQGDFISDLCFNLKSTDYTTTSDKTTCNLRNMTIVFTRPDPDAFISITDPLGVQNPPTGSATSPNISSEIILTSRRGTYKKMIQVYTTGQITVRSAS